MPGVARHGRVSWAAGYAAALLYDGLARSGQAGLGTVRRGKARQGVLTDRQFGKRLAVLENRMKATEKAMAEVMAAVTALSSTFVALASMLSVFTRKPPPDDFTKVKVSMN